MQSEAPKHRARKRFGQNFLEDYGVISSIGAAIAPLPNQHLVEIGPGLGALTAEIIGRAKKVTLIELDRDLIPKLEARFNGDSSWSILSADALNIDFSQLAKDGAEIGNESGNESGIEIGNESQKIRVVGNLPYNISTPLIFHLLEHAKAVQDMHFMLQKEVVLRLTAKPGTGAWGRLGIMVQYFCDTEFLLEVPPHAFNPAPKVDSAVVRLTPRTPRYPAKDLAKLELVLKTAFAQRRKTLRNTLKTLFNTDQLAALDIDPSARPETLTLEEYVRLSNSLT